MGQANGPKASMRDMAFLGNQELGRAVDTVTLEHGHTDV